MDQSEAKTRLTTICSCYSQVDRALITKAFIPSSVSISHMFEVIYPEEHPCRGH